METADRQTGFAAACIISNTVVVKPPIKSWSPSESKSKHSTFVSSTFNTTHNQTEILPIHRTTWMGRYHKGKTNLDFTEATDSECQWHQLGHMQVCTSLQTNNHASTPPLSFLQAGCPSCHPTNSVKAPKAKKYCQYMSIKSILVKTIIKNNWAAYKVARIN